MTKSMTGFGRAQKKSPDGELVIEIQSINRKNFEANIYLPWGFSSLEALIRKEIAKYIFRGTIQVKMFFYPETLLKNAIPSFNFLKELKAQWEKTAGKLGYDPKLIDLNFLTSQLKMFPKPEEKVSIGKLKSALFACLKQALLDLDKMRKQEGLFLQKDLLMRLKTIKKQIDKIQAGYPKSLDEYRKKLEKKIQSLNLQDETFKKEIFNYAEKIDITEEIVRFQSHIKQFGEILRNAKDAKGRKLEFILQEMSREMNTICSKSNDVDMVSLGIECKNELEKIKEQVQNIQ